MRINPNALRRKRTMNTAPNTWIARANFGGMGMNTGRPQAIKPMRAVTSMSSTIVTG
jgi:hypothetical protein